MHEYTIALIKPDAIRRRLMGKILTRIEEEGFEIRTLARLRFSRESATVFYGLQHEGQPYFHRLVDFMASGPSLRLLLQREDAIAHWRAVMGPWKAAERALAPHSIRGAFMGPDDTLENLVHGSDSGWAFNHECRACGWHPGLLP
jgi:nucleoside-diphosphate kinase